MKEITNKPNFINIKTSALENIQENEKARHRMGGSMCKKSYHIKDYYPKIYKEH